MLLLLQKYKLEAITELEELWETGEGDGEWLRLGGWRRAKQRHHGAESRVFTFLNIYYLLYILHLLPVMYQYIHIHSIVWLPATRMYWYWYTGTGTGNWSMSYELTGRQILPARYQLPESNTSIAVTVTLITTLDCNPFYSFLSVVG